MTTMEIIVGAIATVLALIFGAFHLGKSQGKSVADANAEQQRTEESAAATVAAAERRAEVTKGGSDVQQTVSYMPDDDVDRELRESFTRKT
ncbi:TPA: hypothetical protein MM109_004776 [Klebsiella pneumoniae]|uniref:hypothetical protein n=1 Tax=Klebsiella pneumoniae complex TaxID=3390273 RepID=UPI000E2C3E0A|nr:hypothetical protein [Klebsiella pneumoniae]HCT9935173.1 hypothetical protein [Klebsiella variicola]HDU4485932.1 hypothetical protein [Klebsiella pneumoniae subsp. pneumoniae]MCP6008306.1 hypothetical protein [Klebsiella pneumoniae]MCQ0550908.1 hypothetical protein [Klebsiella pneumoniae]MCY4734163.1 hypothetical protein [Klebsiella pneumoniae]